jgi:hypothetical protein
LTTSMPQGSSVKSGLISISGSFDSYLVILSVMVWRAIRFDVTLVATTVIRESVKPSLPEVVRPRFPA